MATSGAGARPGAPDPATRPGVSTSPIAVVWCRQVDNEAESPGYTTVPEEFPGHRETLEVIRTVGNLTVNVADTHDYWDPDPSQPLSYYPNLFLYPAYGGRYTCLGRMFLSTEDRPRLGMKTLVLDTAQLVATGEFGATILRWHGSMGGPRRDGIRPPPTPDPALYPIVGEGFLFHRGSTDPVVLVAAEEWEPALQALLDLIRVLPASLISLGAILAFPYFLPQPKTNLHEFTEQLPLSLALMRVPRGEAAGDRHQKRMASWESAPVTLRDLTQGAPPPSRAKEAVPLVLQYVRDHLDQKLVPISQRVDFVEGPRVRTHLADPERQGGRDRRKEMWRIGTAMESAAMLMQRARGRHVPVNVETAKRAQEYLQARIPENLPAPPSSVEAAVIAPSAALAATAPGQVPPWLQRAPEPALPPPPPSTPEIVPVSIKDDPSLLPPAPPSSVAPPQAAAAPPLVPTSPASRTPSALTPPPASLATAPAPPPTALPTSSPVPTRSMASQVDTVALKIQIEQDLLKLLEERIRAVGRTPPVALPATALDEKVRADLDARYDSRIASAVQQLTAQFRQALDDAEGRQAQAREEGLRSALSTIPPPPPADALDPTLQADLDARTDARIAAQVALVQSALAQGLKTAEDRERRAREDSAIAAEARFIELSKSTEGRLKDLATASETRLQELDTTTDARLRAIAAESDGKVRELTAQWEVRLRDLAQASEARIAQVGALTDARLKESASSTEPKMRELASGAAAAEVERRLDARIADVRRAADEAIQRSAMATRESLQIESKRALTELSARIAAAEEELRKGLSAQLELELRESADREIEGRQATEKKLVELLQSRAQEIDAKVVVQSKDLERRLGILIDGRSRDTHEKVSGLTQQQDARLAGLVEEKVAAAEGRVGQTLEVRLTEAQEARVSALADLQVRLQSYFEQKLREEQDRERTKYLELLGRLKGEIETSLGRMVDSSRFDTALRERIGRSLEAFRAETERVVDSRLATAEQKLKVDLTEQTAQLASIEQAIEARRAEVRQLEDTLRADMDDLDRRSQILADRLVPIVRKTWLRVAELQQGGPSGEAETQINQLRREMNRELQRVETEVQARTMEVRERMETTISQQGRVWLTLIRQLSQLTGDRRIGEMRRAAEQPDIPDEADLESMPALVNEDSDEPVNPMDPDPSEDVRPNVPGPRRRLRRTTR